MNVVAIICEYNPFHSGHKYQIYKVREIFKDAYIVSLMSGNFVQRGDCAILDKYTRAKIAVKNGSDLVLELPIFFSTQVAQIFARGSISVLNSLECIDYLCFGSESEDIKLLKRKAQDLIDFEKSYKKDKLKSDLKSGKSFINSYGNINELSKDSNDILAIEYIKSLIQTKSKIKPYAIKRQGALYNDEKLNKFYSSATSIRKSLKVNSTLDEVIEYLPDNSLQYFDRKFMKFQEDFYNYIKYNILLNKEKIKEIFEVNEGLENLLYKNAILSSDIEEIIFSTKSKRYTLSKIRRILFNILLDIRKEEIQTIKKNDYKVPYIKVLSFNEKGRSILKSIKNNSQVEIINKVAKYKFEDYYSNLFFEKEIKSTYLYNIEKKSYYYDDFLTTPIYFEN